MVKCFRLLIAAKPVAIVSKIIDRRRKVGVIRRVYPAINFDRSLKVSAGALYVPLHNMQICRPG